MGKVILFVQQKGGAGKSTLLSQLAVYLASRESGSRGGRVAVVDLDPQRSTAAWFAERQALRGGEAGMMLVEGAEWRAASDIRDAASETDWALVDAPGSADVLGRGALRVADFALIPCQPSMADVWASKATLEMARKANVPHAVVLNRYPPRGRAAEVAAAVLHESGTPVLEPRIGARTAFADAFMRGAGVTETARSSKAAEEIVALAEALARVVR
jgi:chromosome partitioning protein